MFGYAKYKEVLYPDFSMYIEINKTIQIYNTFRNRWCGAYFASKGIKVTPNFEKPHINYEGEIPELKMFYQGESAIMKFTNNEDYRFITISDFKDCIIRGGEVEFNWKGRTYSIVHPYGGIYIGEGYYDKDGERNNVLSHEKCIDCVGLWGDTADKIIEYNVGGDRLQDIITQIEVDFRTILIS